MKRVALIHTGFALVNIMRDLFSQILGDTELVNIVDDSLLRDVLESGQVSASVRRRMLIYFDAADEYGVDCILSVCSSVGEVVDLARMVIKTPIIKIDDKMTEEAVKKASNIGVVATLQSTLGPTCRLIEKKAVAEGRKIQTESILCSGAFEELIRGNTEAHDEIVLKAIGDLACRRELVVLAQGSMARLIPKLDGELKSKVLSSPESGVRAVKELLDSLDA